LSVGARIICGQAGDHGGDVSELRITTLNPDTWDGLADLFSSGNPSFCWCAQWRGRGQTGSRERADANRALLRELTEQGEPAPGLVATRDGTTVGWVSLGPREDYPRLMHSTVLAPVDDRPVWSIVCFVVAKPERGRGVGTALLEAAIGYARERGATTLEAYPVDTSAGPVTAASAYAGTLPMFQQAGFEVVTIRRATPTTRPRPIVRLELT
jgi:GNAT superfamily N-acetyltransferase